MASKVFTCWHGQLDDRLDEEELRAYDASTAAERFALAHDEGDDYDIVFVMPVNGSKVEEFKCTYNREVSCRSRQTATHDAPTDEEEV